MRQHLAALEASFPALSAQEIVTLAEHTSPTQSTPAPIQPTRRPRPVRRFLAWAGPIAAVLLIVLLTVSVFSVRGHPAASNQGTPALYVSTLRDIVALRQSDGKLLWRSSVTSDTFSTPISDHGIVYSVAFRANDFSLVALSANEGKELWERTLPPDSQPSITAANGIVFVVTVVYHCCQSQTLDQPALLAYRGSDGKELWRYDAPTTDVSNKTNSNIQPQFSSSPVVYGNTLYIGLEDTVQALQANTGQHLWTAPLNLAPAAVAPDGTTIYTPLLGNEWLAADATSVYAYTDIPHQETPESAYVNGSFAQVFALRASDGASLWQADLGADLQDDFLPPVISNNTLYVEVANLHPASATDTAFLIYALQADTGAQLLELKEPGTSKQFFQQAFTYAFTYSAGALYYTKPDGSLDALHLSDRRLVWNYTLGVAATFLGTSDTAVFLLTFTSIQALSISDGHLLWEQVLAHLK
jgi:outer membrane protein assembly factor BamB